MLTSIVGFNLPGCVFGRPDGSLMNNVHVGLQVGREPAELVKADASEARWDFVIEAVIREGQPDFRGRAVHGKRGDRFLYLTWGEVNHDDGFEMFRRAKLMLTGSTLRPRDLAFKTMVADEIARTVWPYVEGNRLKPVIDKLFPLADAAAAHARMESGEHVGKIVLEVLA